MRFARARAAAPRQRPATDAAVRALFSAVLRELGEGEPVGAILARLCAGVESHRRGLRCAVLMPGDEDARFIPVVAPGFPAPLHAALAGFGWSAHSKDLGVLPAGTAAPGLAAVERVAAPLGLRLMRSAPLSQGQGAVFVFAPVSAALPGGEEILGLFVELAELAARSAADRRAASGLRRADELTGLPVRRAFLERLHGEVVNASRNDVFAVLLLDLDSFRQVNETLGTAAGDFLLRGVTARLEGSETRVAALSRYGEDSFACLLVGERKQERVRNTAAELLRRISDRYDMSGQDLFVTASVGVSLYPWDGEDASTLLRNAELALFSAKQRGRNRVEFYSPATGIFDFDRLRIKTELSRALERGEIQVLYQPKVSCETGEVYGVEALASWRSAALGQISPSRFIPLAEETGLIVEIGEFILRAACTQAASWHDLGFPRLRIAVNVSGVQIHERDFVAVISQVLDKTYLRASSLELELTETVAMQRVHGTLTKLREISALGVHIAIDDFGTGYSSLAYLKTLPIDTLKIDQSFVRKILTSPQDAAVVRTVIALGKNLDLDVVAEGVEEQGQADFLRQEGCHQLQGYLFGRPMAASALTRLLRERKDFLNPLPGSDSKASPAGA